MTEMKNGSPIKVFLLSDNHITRSGLRRILECHPGFHVLGEGSVAVNATVESLVVQRPVILLDLDPNGADALRKLEHLTRSSTVIVLCELGHDELVRKAVGLGVAGIVLKTQPPSVLIAVIQSLCESSGHDSRMTIPIKESVKEPVSHARVGAVTHMARVTERIRSLTARELDIIRLIATGLKNKEVARQLHISDITVRHHLTSIFSKLDVPDRQKLLILAHTHGIVELALHHESPVTKPATKVSYSTR